MTSSRLLSNGRYTVLLTDGGAGFSTCGGYALTAWEGDRTRDADGLFVYLRDLDRGTTWSATRRPMGHGDGTHAMASRPGRVRYTSRHDGIDVVLDVCVPAADDAEIRRVTLENTGTQTRRIELTSYGEVVLNQAAAHAAHPAFAKLFVQTELVAARAALLAWRRPRSRGESHPWLVHACAGPGALEHDSDRARFLGRGRSAADPQALASPGPLSGRTGSVLDPVVSLRRVVELAPGGATTTTLVLGAAPSRDQALALAQRFETDAAVDAAFVAAAAAEQACRDRLGCSSNQAEHYQALAGAMLYGHPGLRADPTAIARASGGLDQLWRYGIGDGAVVVVRVEPDTRLDDVLRMLGYWRTHGVAAKVVALVAPGVTAGEVQRAVAASDAGEVSLLARADLPAEHVALMEARADLLVSGALPVPGDAPAVAAAPAFRHGGGTQAPTIAQETLRFPNGYGGFGGNGSEYVIHLPADGSGRPPMPWANVVANERLGFLASEGGPGLAWCRNSRENRLTPWYNDPVSDPPAELLFVRDEDAGVFWSPLPAPAPPSAPFEVRHGFGYTRWRHRSHDLDQDVIAFVPQATPEPVKITRLRLVNGSDRPRRLTVFSHSRLVLGVTPAGSARFVVTEHDGESGAIFARNRTNFEFADGIVFGAAVVPPGATVRWTADRAEFLGSGGRREVPAAVTGAADLGGRAGAALDPCIAWQVAIQIPPRGSSEVAFLLGEVTDVAEARALVARHGRPGAITSALEGVQAFWSELLGAVQVTTPLPEIDVLVNGWLGYQTLACRLWARSAFYQSGGAFGFRDQLQDAAALVHLRPAVTRAQLLWNAAHQFVEGDVLHWWHPPTGRGTRTRFSDDLLWLPLLTAFYVRTTGDWGVLDESVRFLMARALEPGEDEAYLVPEVAADRADLYEHCCRALDRGMTRGAHGLPLMGTGDWNDGMNRVGREGRGESVWVGFFLYRIVEDFAFLCARRGDHERLARYRGYQADLRAALEDAGWDGAWYRRAYYDDGTPLGSASNQECRIDAIAQAWSVISGAASRERAERAMDAAMTHLVSERDGIIRLLAPPFDRDPHDPGYIKGYVPGIRENGGQYTHGALWVVQALAELGRRNQAAATLAMLTPVRHARTRDDVARYQVEPYVVAADVYGTPPHVGRGGWTWYTGSAGWMYRVALESILGVRMEGGDTLWVRPCVPDAWDGFAVRLRLAGGTTYEVVVRNPTHESAAVVAAAADGEAQAVVDGGARVPVRRDGHAHRVEVTLGAAAR